MRALFALSVDQLKNISLAGVVAPIVIGLLLMKFVAKAMVRTVIMVIAVVLAVAVYSQRQEISECYDDARSGDAVVDTEITCTFFGQDVSLSP
ncbi:MAG: hypothetical protein FJW09_00450 [Actinobacteria bacterium]|nr:hypothetical protein [Actinomycetota bacterium]